MFFKCGLIEAWGRGFDKIVEGCREYAGPRPNYKISANGVMVLCKACPAYEKLKTEQVEGASTVEKTVEKSVEKIVAFLRREPSATQNEIAATVGLSRRGVEKNLKNLKVAGRIRRIGPDKGGHWEVVE